MVGKKHLAVLYGGPSIEHEISIITALQAMEAVDPCLYHLHPIWVTQSGKWFTGEILFDKQFYSGPDFSKVRQITPEQIQIDVCLLCFHGGFGESGPIQGMLEMAKIPYTGCGVAASAISMNKDFCKKILTSHGIPTVEGTVIQKRDAMQKFSRIIQNIGLPYPLFVKPNQLGSSIACNRVENDQELKSALAKVFYYDTQALVERCVGNLMEINVSVLEGNPPRISVVEIPIPKDGKTLSFEDKYLRKANKTPELGMAGLTRVIDPDHLSVEHKEQIQHMSLKAFAALDLGGVVRFDYLMDTQSGQIYFNELNTIPGSLAYYLWEKSEPELLYCDLIDELVSAAEKRFEERLTISTAYDSQSRKIISPDLQKFPHANR